MLVAKVTADFTVSRLAENFAEEIEALFRKVWIEDADEYPLNWRKYRALTKEQILKEMWEGYQYFGIYVNSKLAGMYKTLLTPHGLFGEHQSVDPAHRRMGLATAMYNHFIAYARQLDCKHVYVNVLANHVTRLKIIEKMGFHKIGPKFRQTKGMRVQIYCKKV